MKSWRRCTALPLIGETVQSILFALDGVLLLHWIDDEWGILIVTNAIL
jgi:hypothetical protein